MSIIRCSWHLKLHHACVAKCHVMSHNVSALLVCTHIWLYQPPTTTAHSVMWYLKATDLVANAFLWARLSSIQVAMPGVVNSPAAIDCLSKSLCDAVGDGCEASRGLPKNDICPGNGQIWV